MNHIPFLLRFELHFVVTFLLKPFLKGVIAFCLYLYCHWRSNYKKGSHWSF